ncbi:MAG: cupin domain-containing protein [Chloroflexota bacterium]
MSNPYHFTADVQALPPDIPADSIISRTVHSSDGLKVTLFGFAAGQELSEHTAAFPAVLHFLAGQAQLTLGQDEMAAGPGAWVYMPPQLPHSIVARTAVTMLLYLLKS